MYKIYVNGTPLHLVHSSYENLPVPGADEAVFVMRYPGKKKFLLNYVDMLEKNRSYRAVFIHHHDLERLRDDFWQHFKIVEAAGGVVFNADRILMMYRRNSWDLPKGKIDRGETREVAAVREVEEETGLSGVERHELVATTYHTYREKKKRILKPTYWYRMSTGQEALVPQTEEDIEELRWVAPEGLFELGEMYGNIEDVLRQTLQQRDNKA